MAKNELPEWFTSFMDAWATWVYDNALGACWLIVIALVMLMLYWIWDND